MKIINNEIKVGDIYRGLMNNAIFEIIEVNKKRDVVRYKVDGNDENVQSYSLESFKRCYLEKIKE